MKSREIPISFCQTCSRNVSCEHQGRRDVERYISKALHQSNTKSLKLQSLISFPRELSFSNTEKVNGFLLGYMHNTLFPDSDIAKSYASHRTKTTCIVNGAIAPSYQQGLVERMRVKPFSITIDGSSEIGLEKTNPLTVRVISDSGVIHTKLLDMCMSSNSTAEEMLG